MVQPGDNRDATLTDGSSFVRTPISRRAVIAGTAWAVPAIVLSQATPAAAVSLGCQVPGTLFDSQARGRLLSGTIGGADLDTLAAVEGAHALELAGGAPDVTVSSPLTVSALSAIQLNLLGAAVFLSDVLTSVAGVDTGVLNQFGYAHESGTVIGASGAVNDATGVVSLDESSTGVPQLANLDLYTILEQATGNAAIATLVTQLTDIQLQIGAVAGRAWMDSLCVPPNAGELTRDYLISYLRLVVASDVIGDLLTALTSTLGDLTISTDAVWDLLGTVPLLGPLLAALGEGALNVTATVDTTLLTAPPIPNDPNSALQIDLGAGSVTIDVAALLGGPYTGEVSPWLNGLAPNSRLFIDYALPGGAVTALLDAFVDDLIERLKDLVFVSVQAGSVTGILPTGLLIEGTLREFLDGEATATLRLVGATINLGALLGPLLAGIGDIVEGALDTLLRPDGALNVIFSALNGLLSALFTVLQGVLVFTVNAQNEATGVIPNDLAVLPVGRYDVAALHIGLLGFVNLLDLFLARGSVGENEPR